MAKIAAPVSRELASGPGWTISDIVCEAGPHDHPFEEQHSRANIAVVVGGTFQYRSSTGRELMTPGSLLLANPGDCFCCSHEHGIGDRCLSFAFAPEVVERRFDTPRIPPIRASAPLTAMASAFLAGSPGISAEELTLQIAAHAAALVRGLDPQDVRLAPGALARVTRAIRAIDHDPSVPHDLNRLAGLARLSPYHFLRAFEAATGATPHQYLLRTRLRRAAVRLRTETGKVLDIALDCGFGDVSNFNRAFRAEFRVSPSRYRAQSHLEDM